MPVRRRRASRASWEAAVADARKVVTGSRPRAHGGARSGPHTRLVKACLEWFELHHITAWKMNTGAFATAGGGFIRAGFPGCPDIVGVMPGSGKFLGVECKTGRGELTNDQRAVRDLIVIDGGVYIEARSVDDLEFIRRG